MQIVINGALTEVAEDLSLADLIEHLDLGGRRLAIEVNEDLVPRSQFGQQRLARGDRVEIIHAVGGG
ncbi:sulfur carrier protein ThiS [Thioalkalicoccus limnaeus]|uniref:Sulfur carrier protein ThiS n=1 Tax=Thioalkalicoccus limnaeus TaxID=120681 RepID=A0ABV4BDS3_9GAMM